jgi:hypothetical protein
MCDSVGSSDKEHGSDKCVATVVRGLTIKFANSPPCASMAAVDRNLSMG